jgi:hypothetical protein
MAWGPAACADQRRRTQLRSGERGRLVDGRRGECTQRHSAHSRAARTGFGVLCGRGLGAQVAVIAAADRGRSGDGSGLQAATRGTMGFSVTRRLLDAASSADTRGRMERGEHARAWEQASRRGGRLDALVSATKGESLRPSTGRSGRSSLAHAPGLPPL